MAVDILYIISHGFTTRMLLQTELISKLTKKGYSVGLVSTDSTDENLVSIAENPNVILTQWNEKSTIWDDDYLQKRMYYLEDIHQNTALLEKFYNGLFFSKSKHPWKRIRPLFYYSIFLLIKLFPFLRNRFLKREFKHLKSGEASTIIKELRPKLLISTYPVSIIEAKLLYAAKQNGIQTVQHLLSWDNISCKGKFPVLADYFIAWGEIMKEELQSFYAIKKEKIDVCGVPHFDEHVKERESNEFRQILKSLNLSEEKPYLFLAMSSPRFAPREIDIVEWLAQEIEENTFGTDLQLVLRPHPQNITTFMAKESWLQRLDSLSSHRVGIDYPQLVKSNIRWSMKKGDMRHLSHLIAGCSVCLNSGSTVAIDALMHNKPVIFTSFDAEAKMPYWNSARRLVDYNHLAKLIKEGGAKPTFSFQDLKQEIETYLENPNHNLQSRRNALIRECYLDDGRSTERVVEAISKRMSE